MRLQEFHADGLAGSSQPIHLELDDAYHVAALAAADRTALTRCIEGLLYPERVPDLDALKEDPAATCALRLRFRGQYDLTILRARGADSVQLQLFDAEQGAFRTRAIGGEAVATALTKRLSRPPWEQFRALYLPGQVAPPAIAPSAAASEQDSFAAWLQPTTHELEPASLFGDGPTAGSAQVSLLPNQSAASPAEVARLREEYRRAEQAEELDDQIADLERRILVLAPPPTSPPRVSPFREPSADLELANATLVSPDDLHTMRLAVRRYEELDQRHESITSALQEARSQLAVGLAVLKNPVVVPGTLLAILCTVVSLVGGPGMRIVALGNVPCLAGSLAGVLQYLRLREERRDHRQQVLALEEARDDVADERRELDRRLGLIRRQHGVQSLEELEALVEDTGSETPVPMLAVDDEPEPDDPATRAEVRRLQTEVDELKKRREALGDCPLATFQIAQELRRLGVGTHDDPPAEVAAADTTLDELVPVANRLQLRQLGEGFDSSTQRLWERMLSALLGRQLSEARLGDNGQLRLSCEPALTWEAASHSQRRLIVEATRLTLALQAASRSNQWRWVLRADPFSSHDEATTKRLERLYVRVSERLQVVVLSGAQPGSLR